MSGFLGLPIIGGGSPLFLGSFQFQDFEVPESLSFGGKNCITVHRLPGGRRVFDNMGTEENDISWSGILLSFDAEARALALQTLRQQGTVQTLCFGSFSYNVLISEISFDYRQANHIPYKISCVVVDNQTQSEDDDDPSLSDSVSDDVDSANDVDITSTADDLADYAGQVSDALAPVVSAVQNGLGAISTGSAAALSLLTSVQTSVATVQAVANTASVSFTALGDGPISAGGIAAAGFVTSANALASQVSQLNIVGNYLGRVVNNLAY